jgi:hypothetical protein
MVAVMVAAACFVSPQQCPAALCKVTLYCAMLIRNPGCMLHAHIARERVKHQLSMSTAIHHTAISPYFICLTYRCTPPHYLRTQINHVTYHIYYL